MHEGEGTQGVSLVAQRVDSIDDIISVLEKERLDIENDMKKKMQEEIARETQLQKSEEEPLLVELQDLKNKRKEKLKELRTLNDSIKKYRNDCQAARERTYAKIQDLEKKMVADIHFS
tara:strand:- start:147 stop:500 length:354 start_codon:yes stop_codon:yes gene_type:complete